MADQPSNNETYDMTFRVSRTRRSVPRARRTVRAVLTEWGVSPRVRGDAELVLSELVTNAVGARAPRDRQVAVRVVRLEEGDLRMEVSDTNASAPRRREPVPGEDEGGYGLLLVDALAYRWGTERRACGIGKTVWAQVRGGMPAEPAEVTATALTIQPGHHIHAHGTWHTVRSVRTEPFLTGGLTLVLSLEQGPALRVSPAATLRVRGGPGVWAP
ncbi:ATP-binding protein [Streptomyces albus subsp. chlorinus]|uniref:ATP-binding protein n=1 Tax=Streptomyces albus TaxID=1888 RepID=UPI00156DCC2F|nr:ATP-binding protein [Streptomyces albus]NSC24061.1 ATP-binding protein [Streptomyces albus subsp. chlorinus]